ncbi:MAG: Na+/H+ antiporter NhaC family protein, partial [Verrucomicrobiota bacterium]
ARQTQGEMPADVEAQPAAASALLPLGVLLTTLFVGFYFFGLEKAVVSGELSYFPITTDKLADAFGGDAGPFVMTLAAVVATLCAFAVYPYRSAVVSPVKAFGEGVQSMLAPTLVLIAAWMLSSTLSDLQAGDLVARLAGEHLGAWLLPLLIFICGALISFMTGTSWGTMGILMPLAIPMVIGHPGLLAEAEPAMLAAVVGAVFSGAVFGDHCSPISDTTIVSSIACGVEPADHVRTQLPYALLAAAVAAVAGFLPAGLGEPGWLGLIVGGLVLTGWVVFRTRRQID